MTTTKFDFRCTKCFGQIAPLALLFSAADLDVFNPKSDLSCEQLSPLGSKIATVLPVCYKMMRKLISDYDWL
jgi:hypothetical protein